MAEVQISENVENSDLRSTIDNLWNFVNTTIDKLGNLKNQNEELLLRNSTLEKSLGDKDSNFYDLINQKSELEIRIHNLNIQNLELERRLESNSSGLDLYSQQESEFKSLKAAYEDLELKYNLTLERANFAAVLSDDLKIEREKYSKIVNEKFNLEQDLRKLSEIERNLSMVSKELAHKNFLLNERAVEIDKLKDKIADLDNVVFKLKSTENQFISQIHQKNTVQDEFENFRIENERNVSEIIRIKDLLEIEVENLKSEISDLTLQTSQLKQSNMMLVDENEILNQRIKDLSNNTVDLEEVSNLMENTFSVKDLEINSLISKVEELEHQINSKPDVILPVLPEEYSDIDSLYIDLLNLREKLSSSEKLLQEEKTKMEVIETELLNTNDELNKKDEQISQLSLEIETIKSKIEEKDFDNELLKENIEKLNLIVTSEQSTAEEIRLEINSKDLLIEENNNKIEELKQIISNLSQKIMSKDKEIISLKADNEKSSLFDDNLESLNQYVAQIQENELALESKNAKILQLEKLVNELNGTIIISDLNLKQSRERLDSLEDLLKTRYEQINILESQINEIVPSKKDDTPEILELAERINDYITHIDRQIAAIEN
ncbi:MAG: hypothetical protein RO257_14000 [Candidatus Kapabacteria bacterium]|nr:hypothetical protein [Candidatus Kapabacteria bacterium]